MEGVVGGLRGCLVYGEMIDVMKVILGCWNVEFDWISALEKGW